MLHLLQSPLSIGRAFSTTRVIHKEGRKLQRYEIPPARLRALISLYHNSSTFITPANLSEKIDIAFTDPYNISGTLGDRQQPYEALVNDLKKKRTDQESQTPPVYNGVPLHIDYQTKTWSDQTGVRMSQVVGSLWGTQSDNKPQLETVREQSAINEKQESLFEQTANTTRQ